MSRLSPKELTTPLMVVRGKSYVDLMMVKQTVEIKRSLNKQIPG